MTQILKNTPAQISATWFVDGDVADPGAGVTVDIVREDGTVLEDDAATVGTGAAARTFALTAAAHTNLVDVLTATWTSATLGTLETRVEVVGDLLFTEAQARAFDKSQLSDGATYSDALLMDAREWITDDFQELIGVAPVPRYRLVTLDGGGKTTLRLPNIRVLSVRSVETRASGTQTWTAFTAAELADVFIRPGGWLARESLGTFPAGVQNVRVGYEHGHARVLGPLREAALWAVVELVRRSDIDPRATSFSDGLGTYRLVTPGLSRNAQYETPRINRILKTFDERVLGVG